MTITDPRPLSVSDAVSLGAICAATSYAKVARVIGDDVVYGIARCIGDTNGNFAGPGDDIRDCYLRVTTRSGFEAFWKVSELIDEHRQHLFVIGVDFPASSVR